MVTKPISMINAIGNEEGTYRAGVTSEGRLMVDTSGGGGGDVNLVEIGGNAVAKTTNNIDNISLSGVAGFQEVISLTALYDSANTVWARWYGNTAGGYVQGNVASGASDSGNPLKVGGRYNSSPPTFTNGQRGDLQLTASGQLITADSVADGADVALGAIADAAASAGGTGTVSAKLRRISTQLPAALGLASRSASMPVVIADISVGEYETVAASQTAQVLGATGGTGDYLSGLLVIPATTSPGNVLLLDNATSITVFTGGASSVTSLIPFFIPFGMYSVSGAWKVTTGANVSVIGIGNFT